jgi:LmbE family N-acetylglucosaminyl deacetylase
MLVFAHPDDEVIALGGRLARFGPAHFIHVTDGAPRNEGDSRAHGFATLDQYRKARAGELLCALSAAGLTNASESFDIPDQEASHRLLQVTDLVAERLDQHGPEVVFTHPYEGGHPDHDACAFAVQQAVTLRRARGKPVPIIIEAPFYHAGPHGMLTGEFLPGSPATPGISRSLSPGEQKRKRDLFACFTTQAEVLRSFPLDRELFRIAPVYDFTHPPHPGPVFYDGFPWGMTSQRFCELARHALESPRQELVSAWP